MEGDLIFSWLPTMALTKKDLLGLRASLGFAGGLFTSSKDETREKLPRAWHQLYPKNVLLDCLQFWRYTNLVLQPEETRDR